MTDIGPKKTFHIDVDKRDEIYIYDPSRLLGFFLGMPDPGNLSSVNTDFTIDGLMGKAERFFASEETAANLHRNIVNRFRDGISPDGRIDTKKEQQVLEGCINELAAKMLEDFIDRSGEKGTWLKCSDDLGSLFVKIIEKIKFDQLDDFGDIHPIWARLLDRLDLSPLLDEEVMDKWASQEPTNPSYSNRLEQIISGLLHFHKDEIAEDIAISYVRTFKDHPERISAEFVGSLIGWASGEGRDKLADFIFGSECEGIIGHLFSKFPYDYSLMSAFEALVEHGHPVAWKIIREVLTDAPRSLYSQLFHTLPKDEEAENSREQNSLISNINRTRNIIQDVIDKVITADNGDDRYRFSNIDSKYLGSYVTLRLEAKGLFKKLAFRNDPYAGNIVAHYIFEQDHDQTGVEEFLKLEEEWRADAAGKKPPYAPPTLQNISSYLLSLPYERESRNIKYLWNRIGEGFTEMLRSGSVVLWNPLKDIVNGGTPHAPFALITICDAMRQYLGPENDPKAKSMIGEFLSTGINVDNFISGLEAALKPDDAYIEMHALFNVLTENETMFEDLFSVVVKLAGFDDDNNNFGSVGAIKCLGTLYKDGKYGRRPLDSIADVVLRGYAAHDTAWDQISRLKPRPEDERYLLEKIVEIASIPNQHSLDAAEDLIEKFYDSLHDGPEGDKWLEGQLSVLPLSHIQFELDSPDGAERARKVFGELSYFENEVAFATILERFETGTEDWTVRVLKEILEVGTPQQHGRIIETAVRMATAATEDTTVQRFGMEMLTSAAHNDRAGCWEGLLDVAINEMGADSVAANMLIVAESESNGEELYNALCDLDHNLAEYVRSTLIPSGSGIDPVIVAQAEKLSQRGFTEASYEIDLYLSNPDEKQPLGSAAEEPPTNGSDETKNASLDDVAASDSDVDDVEDPADNTAGYPLEDAENTIQMYINKAKGNGSSGDASYYVEKLANIASGGGHGSSKAVEGLSDIALTPGTDEATVQYALQMLVSLATQEPPVPEAQQSLSELTKMCVDMVMYENDPFFLNMLYYILLYGEGAPEETLAALEALASSGCQLAPMAADYLDVIQGQF